MMEEEKLYQVLEINLVSAQNLKVPSKISGKTRRTYAVIWVDGSLNKLRTRTDCYGGENPTWNDKFLFRVSSDLVTSATAGFTVEIYAAGHLRDSLVGRARCLLSSCLGKQITPVYVHRPSGNFHGILNVAAAISEVGEQAGTDSGIFQGSSMVSFHDLTRSKARVKEESFFRRLRLVRSSPSLSAMSTPPPPASPLTTKSKEVSTMKTAISDPSLFTMMLSSSSSSSSSPTLSSDDEPDSRAAHRDSMEIQLAE
ncbi:OLC1v1031657C1 [Oldenlandia corymbosa var. corymbosa]|uniref:OLC1v1031657C1 n=1 Tax=Oldenlandia corymbosa var. corymbosa TaxID=529605 RepID=A0AAV1CJN7_OLDCO|nr:OLC1v1031657C1 [Oldenlandia corymbosa var. corymbosa]